MKLYRHTGDCRLNRASARRYVHHTLFSAIVAGLAASASPMVLAQDAEADSASRGGLLEEVVVTARKRGEEVLQDIPASITAITEQTLREMGVSDFEDFAYQVPGLTFTEGGPGEKRYIIRGIQSAGQQQVAVYYDEVPLPGVQGASSNSGSQTTDLKIYDVSRVEVLRGPQGTTFGANSQSGTVRFITNKPVMNEVEASVRADYSVTQHGGDNWGGYAMMNIPLAEDKLAFRLVAYSTEDSGYVDNVRLGMDDINWTETVGARGILRWEPTENVTLDAMIWHQDRDNGGDLRYHPYDTIFDDSLTQAEKVLLSSDQGGRDNVSELAQFQTGGFNVGDYTQTPKPDDQTIYSLTLNWELPFANLTAAASRYDRDFRFKFDSSWILFFLGIRPASEGDPGTRPDLFPALTDQKQSVEQDAFEIRLTSTHDGPFQWLAGAFWRNRESEFQSYVPVVDENGDVFDPGTAPGELLPPNPGAGIEGCLPCVFGRIATKDIEEIAFFGEVTYAFNDWLEGTVGLRWFEVDQSDFGVTVFPFALFPPNPALPLEQDFSENRTIPKFQLAAKPNDNVTIFALASQGFRLGGTNNQGVVDIPPFYEADDLWNYELGIKSEWFDNRMIFNASLFHIVWDNLQVSGEDPTGAFGFVGNAGSAEVTGLEAEVFASPNENWNLTFGLSWLPKKELTEDQVSDEIVAPGLDGDEIPRIPELTVNGTAQYNFPLPVSDGGWWGFVRGEYSYKDGSSTDLRPFTVNADGSISSPNQRDQDDYQIVNLRFGVHSDALEADFILYAENVFDVEGDVFLSGANGQPTAKITNRPRTVGIQFNKQF
ncbi:TonB-dependent receptor [Elongatibacter sediminis]|uniref:TonB-dependent receptor n=1 Tax=Elongatibacter sediminis TaxID=3119006 RepID=A0AAW9RD65_9GAMM